MTQGALDKLDAVYGKADGRTPAEAEVSIMSALTKSPYQIIVRPVVTEKSVDGGSGRSILSWSPGRQQIRDCISD